MGSFRRLLWSISIPSQDHLKSHLQRFSLLHNRCHSSQVSPSSVHVSCGSVREWCKSWLAISPIAIASPQLSPLEHCLIKLHSSSRELFPTNDASAAGRGVRVVHTPADIAYSNLASRRDGLLSISQVYSGFVLFVHTVLRVTCLSYIRPVIIECSYTPGKATLEERQPSAVRARS